MLINHFCKRYQKKSSKKGRFFWPKLISWQIRPAPLHWAWAEPSRATRKSEGTRRGWPSGMTIWDERMNFMEFHEFQRHILGWKFHEFHELWMHILGWTWTKNNQKLDSSDEHWPNTLDRSGPKAPAGSFATGSRFEEHVSVTRNDRNEKDVENRKVTTKSPPLKHFKTALGSSCDAPENGIRWNK